MKTTLLCILLMFFSLGLFSQLGLYITGGANYSNVFFPNNNEVNTNENRELTPILNFNGGLLLEYQHEKFILSSGFLLSRRGAKIGDESTLAWPFVELERLQFYFWEIPLIVRFPILEKRFEIGGGIVNAILSDADVYLASTLDKPYQIDFKSCFRWNVNKNLSTELGYLIGGLNHFGDDVFYGHSVFNLNVNYRIWNINWRNGGE